MEMQFRFKGTPKQFGWMVLLFSRQFNEINEDRSVWSPYVVRDDITGSDNPSKVTVLFGGHEAKRIWEYGFVSAVGGVSDNSVLFVTAQGEHWSKLEKWWELLRAEMERQGWLEASQAEADLTKWQQKALNRLASGKRAACEFKSDAIPDATKLQIAAALKSATDKEMVKRVFDDSAKRDTP